MRLSQILHGKFIVDAKLNEIRQIGPISFYENSWNVDEPHPQTGNPHHIKAVHEDIVTFPCPVCNSLELRKAFTGKDEIDSEVELATLWCCECSRVRCNPKPHFTMLPKADKLGFRAWWNQHKKLRLGDIVVFALHNDGSRIDTVSGFYVGDNIIYFDKPHQFDKNKVETHWLHKRNIATGQDFKILNVIFGSRTPGLVYQYPSSRLIKVIRRKRFKFSKRKNEYIRDAFSSLLKIRGGWIAFDSVRW